MEVNVRTFSNNPSRYLREARSGTEVVITMRNIPAFRLVPIPQEISTEEHLRRLAAIPGVKLGKGRLTLPPLAKLSGEGLSASEMILEDRK